MIGVNSNHCQIVEKSLTGERVLDEQTFASLAILTERLERLKKLGDNFGSVTLSPAVKKLKEQKNAMIAYSGW